MTRDSSGPATSLKMHCRGIARRFLLTAVVVDDELSVTAGPQVHASLTPPGRGASRRAPAQLDPPPPPPKPLNVQPITWSFARRGMVCGVVSPQGGQSDFKALGKAVARADIVILDWRLDRKGDVEALPLLEQILKADQQHRLRLVALYTGEPDQEAIRQSIAASLDRLGAPDRAVRTSGNNGPIDFGACRIVMYAKPGTKGRDSSKEVSEDELADQLIADFAEMAEGLLPSLVLTALAAVRDNVYRLLDRFGKDLDPAFLAHRACLPQPSDSEQHIVEQIASELHGIMADAVDRRRPADIEAIGHWLADRFENGRVKFSPRHEATESQVLDMLRHGLKAKPGPLGLGKFKLLSHGFSVGAHNEGELDGRLAAAMSFRQVLEGTSRQLSMGTVVRRIGDDNATQLLLCVIPRCDSVRLTKKSSFLFVPLSDPKPRTPQVVITVDGDEPRRKTICTNPSQWSMEDFVPDPDRQCVLAERSGPDKVLTFSAADGGEYRWVGELKLEFAQSIAQTIAKRMSRMPLNKSEWLRRLER